MPFPQFVYPNSNPVIPKVTLYLHLHPCLNTQSKPFFITNNVSLTKFNRGRFKPNHRSLLNLRSIEKEFRFTCSRAALIEITSITTISPLAVEKSYVLGHGYASEDFCDIDVLCLLFVLSDSQRTLEHILYTHLKKLLVEGQRQHVLSVHYKTRVISVVMGRIWMKRNLMLPTTMYARRIRYLPTLLIVMAIRS